MDFIEKLTGLSPDGGSGLLEIAWFAGAVAVAAVAAVAAVLVRRRGRGA